MPPIHPAKVSISKSPEPALFPVIPRPVSITITGDNRSLELNGKSRIVIRDGELAPLAQIFAGEVELLTGLRLPVGRGDFGAGDILLEIDAGLKGETYGLDIDSAAIVRGRDSNAVASGTATLLQLLKTEEQAVLLPCVVVEDAPFCQYRGLMIDLARQPHRLQTLKRAVIICRYYKIRYLHLHFSDDQTFTFPSAAFPMLGQDRRFSIAEMRELERFASERGVVIIPELDVPGHAKTMVRDIPILGGDGGLPEGVLCPGKETTYEILDTLIGEMCAVFQSSPYFHIGADEFDVSQWQGCDLCQACMSRNGIGNLDELQRYFIVRMDRIVRKYGKQTIAWEGFAPQGTIEIPKDIIVMIFESLYATAPELLAAGYKIINTSWQPLYVVNERAWSPETIYAWNHYRWENWWDKSRAYPHGIQVGPNANVIGAQMCAWAQPDALEIPSLRMRAAAMAERIWNPDAGVACEDFMARLAATDARLESLMRPFQATA